MEAQAAQLEEQSVEMEAQQAELLKSYLKVREELHQTQLAIVNNRVAGVTEKLDWEVEMAMMSMASIRAMRRMRPISASSSPGCASTSQPTPANPPVSSPAVRATTGSSRARARSRNR